MKHVGDITQLSGYDLPPVDCVTGGSPCQDLSVAGKREGMTKICPKCGYKTVGNEEITVCPNCNETMELTRSGLFMEQIRIVKEMRQADAERGRTGVLIRPRYMVWENVPGAFSSNGGKDFQAVLTEIVRIAAPDSPDVPMPETGKWPKSGCLYDELGGWSVAWRVHDAQFWGVPQRRKRIALVADFGGLSAPEVLFERKGLSGDSEPGGAPGEGTAEGTEGGSGEPISLQGNGIDRSDNSGCDGAGWRRGGPTPLTEQTATAYAFMGGQGSKAGGLGYTEECSPSLKSVPSGGNTVPDVLNCEPQNKIAATITATYGTKWNGNAGAYNGENFVIGDTPHEEVMACDLRNGREQEVNGTLQAKPGGGMSLNLNNVIRTNHSP